MPTRSVLPFCRYISHFWRHAQEQCGVLKSLLYTMLPTCKIYLDEDGNDVDDEVDREGQYSVET